MKGLAQDTSTSSKADQAVISRNPLRSRNSSHKTFSENAGDSVFASGKLNMISERRQLSHSRKLSFSDSSSPWFRRNSFLLPAMIENENFSVYDSPSFFTDSSSYNIISLKESQGFIFNQDLFASPYQQLRALAMERRNRASSFHSPSGSLSSQAGRIDNDRRRSQGLSCVIGRRHTSYLATRPKFFETAIGSDSLVIGDDEDMSEVERGDVDDTDMDYVVDKQEEDTNVNEKKNRQEQQERLSEDENSFIFENGQDNEDDEEEDGEEDEEEGDDEEEDLEDREYGGDSVNRRYRVPVTEIVVSESEAESFYPS